MRTRFTLLFGLLCVTVSVGIIDRSFAPRPPPLQSIHVHLYNSCPETLFLAASGPSVVSPVGGASWMVETGQNISISIPSNWQQTQMHHKLGPRFWARTGCKYSMENQKAQCETGDCGNFYDCSRAKLAGKAPASLVEFCFHCGDGYTYYDVSLVDGFSVAIDVIPGDHSPNRPGGDPNNPFWCKSNLCTPNSDLRTSCPSAFTLKNSDLPSYNFQDPDTKVACFSNCGKYEYPTAPLGTCTDSDPSCKNWRQYCCQSSTYGNSCKVDTDCTEGGACWNHTCQCKAYYHNPPCPDSVCTNPDGMPPGGSCSDCIGDDTVHQVCPRAYSWPNDPQTYSCDAKDYTITFCPGGTSEKITPVTPIPKCSSLDQNTFDWVQAQKDCAGGHGNYLCAIRKNDKSPWWACNVDKSGCDDVICAWE